MTSGNDKSTPRQNSCQRLNAGSIPRASGIRRREMKDPYDPVPPGTIEMLFCIKWDDGYTLGVVIGEDNFSAL